MMSESQTNGSKPYDPLEPFRGMRDAYLDAMAKTMVEAVNSEAYAQASGAMLDNSLTMSAPFREAFEKSMLQVLQQLSLPSRQDIVVLAERFTNLEMRLDDMDAALDGFESKIQKSMLPVLQQQLLLTEGFTKLAARLDVANIAAKTASAQPIVARAKTVVATPVVRKARVLTKKRAPAGKQVTSAKSAVSRKGAS
ncbi:MAG: hypothetical protein M3O31_15570 [Acidobacteriota bacterium]|nr:hypothetical protein [Acidobacteriota bacterium]